MAAPDPNSQPWLRRSDESEDDYIWFRVYLTNAWDAQVKPTDIRRAPVDQVRSMARTANWLAVPLNAIEYQALRAQWKPRAAAYDAHILQRYLGNRLTTVDEHRASEDQLIRDSNQVVAQALEIARVAMGPDGKEATAAREKAKLLRLDIPKLMDISLHYANLLHKPVESDEANAPAGGSEQWDFSEFTDTDFAELRRLRKLAKLD